MYASGIKNTLTNSRQSIHFTMERLKFPSLEALTQYEHILCYLLPFISQTVHI